MHHAHYNEVVGGSGREERANEARAFGRAIELLESADQQGRRSRAAIDALYFVDRLWSTLMEDLASPENGLPAKLRADLISIGIWVLKEGERIRREESSNFTGLINVCQAVRGGLQ